MEEDILHIVNPWGNRADDLHPLFREVRHQSWFEPPQKVQEICHIEDEQTPWSQCSIKGRKGLVNISVGNQVIEACEDKDCCIKLLLEIELAHIPT